ncbi:MAG: sugar phosphate isomerase/epimerase [Firmicutes bacterium]|nr:sugar phosphate isomerase/epimerase [Bacillota bacterium]
MKISVITDEFTQDLAEAIAFARDFSLSGLELRTIDNLPFEQLSEDRLCEIGYAIHSAGLSICSLAGSFGKCLFRDREGENKKLEKLIRAAKILHAPYIRGFGFFSEDGPSLEEAAKALAGPVRRLEQEGITLLLEADPSVTTTNHRKVKELIEQIDRPNVGAIYDPGNDIWDPQGEKPFPDGWNEVKAYVRHIHIKDARMTEKGAQAVKVGSGEVDFPSILKAVRDSGYEGFLSLETHYRVQGDLSEEQMKTPGGAAFSSGGWQACRESMEELKNFLGTIE